MKFTALLVITVSVLSGKAAEAFCSKPDAPYCASRYGNFDDESEFDRCKSEMESFKYDTESYLSCLRRESEDAVNDYDDAVTSFNRRARG